MKQTRHQGREHAERAADLERSGHYDEARQHWMLAASGSAAPQRQWCEGRAAMCLCHLAAQQEGVE